MRRRNYGRLMVIALTLAAIGLTGGIASAGGGGSRNHGGCEAAGGFPVLHEVGPTKASLCVGVVSSGVYAGFDAINTCDHSILGYCTWGAHVNAPMTITPGVGFAATATTSPIVSVSQVGWTGTGTTGASEGGLNGQFGPSCVRALTIYAIGGPYYLGDRGLC